MALRPEDEKLSSTPPQANASSYDRKPRFPSDVIKDAKNWCALRAINTKRPATPLETQRSLFGGDAQRPSRPPSTYSLGAHHFDASDPNSRPSSGALAPIKSKLEPLKIKPLIPSIDKLTGRRKSLSAGTAGTKFHRESSSPMRAERHMSSASPVKAYTDYRTTDSKESSQNGKGDRVHPDTSVRYHPIPASEGVDPKIAAENPPVASSSSSSHRSSRDITEAETKEQALYWNTTVLPLLEDLEDSSSKEPKKLCKTCSLLHDALKQNVSFRTMMPRRRTSLLSSLFRLLNIPCDDLHLKCARIILQVRVNNKNLTSICKLLFRVSRNRNHDKLFVKNELIQPMLNLLEETDDASNKYEAIVYLCGSLKFLSENKTVAAVMYEHDCIRIFTCFVATLLQPVQSPNPPKRLLKQTLDIFVQVTEAFRNMLDADKKVHKSAPSITVMMEILTVFNSDQKLSWILSRVFSKLTVYDSSISYFVKSPGWSECLLSTLDNHINNDEIAVRLCFALGNILSHDDQSRDELFFYRREADDGGDKDHQSTCVRIVLKLIGKHMTRTVEKKEVGGDEKEGGSESKRTSSDDVVVKSIRVIANMSISENVGERISRNSKLVELLMDVIESDRYLMSEEIMTNSLMALNNLAYYDRNDGSSGEGARTAVYLHRIQLTSILIKLMMKENMMCYVIEIARVLGNLTKYLDVRDLVHEHKVDLMMTALMDSGDRQVVYNACGMLINISGDHHKRLPLIQERIIQKLADVMRDFAPVDWMIAGISCQLSWNLLATTDVQSLEQQDVDILKNTLTTLLDEGQVQQKILQVTEDDQEKANFLLSSWRSDFLSFARPLLARLQDLKFPSNLIPLENCDV